MLNNMPRRRISQETAGTKDKAVEQEGSNILYKARIDMYTKRKHELKDNMNKTYSLIFLQNCNKTIQDRIMAHLEFNCKIKNNSSGLLNAVKILINDQVRARYPYASVTEAMTRFNTCGQLENKSLPDYVKWSKENQDSLAQNMGKDFLMDFVKNTKQYTQTKLM
jgi:hypothetical protein